MPFVDPNTVKEIYRLRQQSKALSEQADELAETLGDLPADQYVAGNFILKVYPTVRFDAVTAERNLAPSEFKKILKQTPNSALARAVLGEDRFKVTQRTYGMTKQIIPVEEDN